MKADFEKKTRMHMCMRMLRTKDCCVSRYCMPKM